MIGRDEADDRQDPELPHTQTIGSAVGRAYGQHTLLRWTS